MKKITLSLSLILFLILLQTDFLTAEVSKNENAKKEKAHSKDESDHTENHDHEEKNKEHEKDHHDHAQEESGQHKDEVHGDHEDNDKHSNQDNHKNHDDHADHSDHNEKDEHGDANHDDHEEEGEGSSGVGPDKGILEKSEQGFKLSPEAIKSFELKIQTVSNKSSEFPRATLVEIKDGKFVYRIRENWIKRVSVKVLKKNKDTVILELSQFQAGDKIIVGGTGFIRVSELVAEEGVSHGHSH